MSTLAFQNPICKGQALWSPADRHTDFIGDSATQPDAFSFSATFNFGETNISVAPPHTQHQSFRHLLATQPRQSEPATAILRIVRLFRRSIWEHTGLVSQRMYGELCTLWLDVLGEEPGHCNHMWETLGEYVFNSFQSNSTAALPSSRQGHS